MAAGKFGLPVSLMRVCGQVLHWISGHASFVAFPSTHFFDYASCVTISGKFRILLDCAEYIFIYFSFVMI